MERTRRTVSQSQAPPISATDKKIRPEVPFDLYAFPFENVVFEGGSGNLLAYVGAVRVSHKSQCCSHSGADLGFYKGGCPIHLKGAPPPPNYFDPCYRNQTIFYCAMLCIRGTSHGPVSVRPSLCPSQVGVLSKRLNESNWFLACELPSIRPTLC